MTQKIENDMRRRIAKFLPRAFATALSNTEKVHRYPISKDLKEMKDHQALCKAAVAHLELLIKLAKWADLPDPAVENEMEQIQLRTMIENAQKEVEGFERK